MIHFKNWTCNEYWVVNIERNSFSNELITIMVFHCISSLLTVILNAICLLAIWRLETLQAGTQLILLNLCAADLLTGGVSQPIFLVFEGMQINGSTKCSIASVSASLFLGLASASWSLLVIASTERYFSIFYPFRYHEFINGSKPKAIVGVVWMNVVIVTGLYHIVRIRRHLMITSVILNGLGCIWMGLIYTRMLYFASHVRRRVKTEQETSRKISKTQQVVKSVTGFLVVVSIVCYSPYSITMYYDFFSSHHTDQILVNWLWCLILANSFINPLCYCVKHTEIRKGVLKLIRTPGLFGCH